MQDGENVSTLTRLEVIQEDPSPEVNTPRPVPCDGTNYQRPIEQYIEWHQHRRKSNIAKLFAGHCPIGGDTP